MSCNKKLQHTNNPLLWHRLNQTQCSQPHIHWCQHFFCHWKHQPPFSLSSLLSFNLAVPFFPLLWSTQLNHPPTYLFIYLFICFTMALILALWPSISWFVWLVLLTPAPLPHICKHTQIHSQSPPPFSSSLLVRLVLFSPLNLNLGRWVEYCVGSKSFKHKCLIPNTHGPHSNSQIITYSSVDNSLPQCLNKQRFVCYI